MEKKEYRCCIDRCLTKTKSIKVKDIIYYLFPSDDDWAAKWEKKIKEFDPHYKRQTDDIVCSLHFAKQAMKPDTRQLVDHALPIYFPNTSKQIPDSKSTPDSTSAESRCCINACPTIFDESDPNIRGFSFPENPDERKKWTFIIEMYNNQKIKWDESMKICTLHFTDSCFITPDQLNHEFAKPSIFKHAIARRKMEIEKQQTQTNNQRANVIKAPSINVPLHRANAENQSMTRRSAPAQVATRRLSLPYKQLPKLLPKPNVVKRIIPTQINGPNGVISVHRINAQNIVLSSKPISKSTLRPLPALNKVVSVSNVVPRSGSNVTVPSVTVLKQSIPVSSNSGSQPTKLIAVPIKRTHITRLPPTLKPAPRMQMKLPSKTYSKAPDGTNIDQPMPIISRVQSIVGTTINTNTTKNLVSSPAEITPIANSAMAIDDEEMEIVNAIDESKTVDDSLNEELQPSTSVLNTNGTPKNVYIVKNNSAYKYPRLLLQRILTNKRKNEELRLSVERWKKVCIKINQENVINRLQKATTTGETIEIS